MKKIPVTGGKYALVDDEDFEFLMQWKWEETPNGYARRNESKTTLSRRVKQTKFYMHRVVNSTPKGMDTDHINRNKLDNRKCNLRMVTRSENMRNTGLQRNNTSGYKGISWDKKRLLWESHIKNNDKKLFLGRYKKLADAIIVRKQAEERLWK